MSRGFYGVALIAGKLAVIAAAAVAAGSAWSSYRDFVHHAPSAAQDPARFTISTALETIGGYRLLFDWQRDAAGYKDAIARAKLYAFPNDRVATPGGYDDTPAGLDKQKNQKLSLAELVKFHDDGSLELLPCGRAQIYHSQLLRTEKLPLAKLDGSRYLSLEIEYRIPRDAERMANLAAVGTWAMRLKLIWCDAAGKPLTADTRCWLHMKLETMGGPDWMTDRIQDVAVPPGAMTVRLDWQLPTLETTLVRACRVLGAQVETQQSPATIDRAAGAGSQPGSASALVKFAPASAPGKRIVGQLVRLRIPGIGSAQTLSREHLLQPLAGSQPLLLGNLLPHDLLLADISGRGLALHISGADLLSVQLVDNALLATCHTYSAAERSYRVYSDVDPQGQRIVRDLGLASSLPPASLHLAIGPASASTASAGSGLLFPTWQQDNRLATLVFTEHADNQSVASDRLAMYGNREGTFAPGSGVLGLGIPISKTFFTRGANSGTAPPPPAGVAAWGTMEEPAFAEHIRKMAAGRYPIEFGLHTAGTSKDPIEATRAGLELLKSLHGDLWIDHGDTYNLDDLCRIGWDPSRPDYYIIPSLRAAGVRYAWTYRDLGGSGLNCVEEGVPSNMLFYLPTLDDDIADDWRLAMFGTRRLEFKENLFSNGPLDELIRQRGTCIVHCYFSYNRFGQIIMENGNPVGLADWFVKDLQEIARRRDDGDLEVITVGQWADHVMAMRQVRITPLGDGRYRVENSTGHAIRGAGFGVTRASTSASASAAAVIHASGGEVVAVRPTDAATYFSLDLPAGVTELRIGP